MSKFIGNLEEEALKRKERLKNLKRKKPGEDVVDDTRFISECEVALPKPKFRSYKPEHDQLKANAIPEIEPGNILSQVQDQLNASTSEEVTDEAGHGIWSVLDMNFAPRKPDWDLKRDVAKKLEKLERRTQRAIAELIRDKLRSQKQLTCEGIGPES